MGERGRKEGEGSEERRGKERGGEERASPLFISSAAPATLSTVFVALSTVFSSSSYSLRLYVAARRHICFCFMAKSAFWRGFSALAPYTGVGPI